MTIPTKTKRTQTDICYEYTQIIYMTNIFLNSFLKIVLFTNLLSVINLNYNNIVISKNKDTKPDYNSYQYLRKRENSSVQSNEIG